MEFQMSYFKSWKMMLWKRCTQYANKYGNSALATDLEKVSFHSNPKERQCQRMLKVPHNCTYLAHWQSNAQNSPRQPSTVTKLADIQVHWTVNFQMFKPDLEKAEEPEIKLPTSVGSSKKQESFRKTSTSVLYWLCPSLWLCGSQQTVENF